MKRTRRIGFKDMKILIAYDGSDCAEAALDDLQRAGLPPEAEAQIISVAEVWLPPPPPSSYEIVEQANEVKVPSDLRRVYSRRLHFRWVSRIQQSPGEICPGECLGGGGSTSALLGRSSSAESKRIERVE
jgi:hypothetical protein